MKGAKPRDRKWLSGAGALWGGGRDSFTGTGVCLGSQESAGTSVAVMLHNIVSVLKPTIFYTLRRLNGGVP